MLASAIIVASGLGRRCHHIPKQFMPFQGKLLLEHTLAPFCQMYHDQKIQNIIVTLPTNFESVFGKYYAHLQEVFPFVIFVEGGDERQDSVYQALQKLKELQGTCLPASVLIHDGARPFITVHLIQKILDTLATADCLAVFPGLPITDTLRYQNDKGIMEWVDRSQFFLTQTPQGFDWNTIINCYEKLYEQKNLGIAYTDDIQLCEQFHIQPQMIPGEIGNKKITFFEDFG